MSLKFKLVQRRNPLQDEAEPRKYYAQPVYSTKKDLKSLSETVARHTTMGVADIYGVLIALQEEIVASLQDGIHVELGDLCHFYPALKSEGADTEEDFDTNTMIKRKTVRIRAKQVLSQKMEKVSLERVS